ncbi:MAG: DUF982 domain-containing protein [Chelatococcus sp.]|nr:DUF982 domain-containing protein [Chelatococcus sp. YT9]MBX3556754.1 DUF982 domain-containing protein [Chelatococcus sp.]
MELRLLKSRIRSFQPLRLVPYDSVPISVARFDEAVIFLIRHWPVAFALSPLRLQALAACRGAMEGEGDPVAAREVLVKAADEAGLLP